MLAKGLGLAIEQGRVKGLPLGGGAAFTQASPLPNPVLITPRGWRITVNAARKKTNGWVASTHSEQLQLGHVLASHRMPVRPQLPVGSLTSAHVNRHYNSSNPELHCVHVFQ